MCWVCMMVDRPIPQPAALHRKAAMRLTHALVEWRLISRRFFVDSQALRFEAQRIPGQGKGSSPDRGFFASPLDGTNESAIYGACLIAQACADRAIRTSLPSSSSIWRRMRQLMPSSTLILERTRLQLRLVGLVARKADARELISSALNASGRSPSKQLRLGGKMTAEVAILNRAAVALAADSAVTVTSGSASKVFNSTNKIFRIGEKAPVGVMFYNNATFMSIPWETIIKIYNDNLGDGRFDTLEEYRQSFASFLEKDLPIQDGWKSGCILSLLSSYMSEISSEIRHNIRRGWLRGNSFNEQAARKLASKIISEKKKEIDELEILNQFVGIDIDDLRINYSAEFSEVFADNFGSNALTVNAKAQLEEICYLSLIKDTFSDDDSGVIIAGFGDKEIFPYLYGMRVDGLVRDILKVKLTREVKIGIDRSSSVNSFAQGEMVSRFMEGIDPGYSDYLEIALPEMLKKFAEKIVDTHVPGSVQKKEAIKRGVVRSGVNMISGFENDAKNFRKEKFVDPVMAIVDILAKEDLAEMAESMVKITSLKRRVSPELETVGGPVDVAVISKVDGFVWIKKKVYFDRGLNQHLWV
jgi:hypothetical protein